MFGKSIKLIDMMKTDNIKEKLTLFGYRFKEESHPDKDEIVLKVYLPILCYLRIRIAQNRIKISSRSFIGFSRYVSLEMNYIIYALIMALLLDFGLIQLNSGWVLAFFIFFIFFVFCAVRLESLKTVIYRWFETELENK